MKKGWWGERQTSKPKKKKTKKERKRERRKRKENERGWVKAQPILHAATTLGERLQVKPAISSSWNILTLVKPVLALWAANCLQNVRSSGPRRNRVQNHVQHIERLSRATCRVTCHAVRRDSNGSTRSMFVGWLVA